MSGTQRLVAVALALVTVAALSLMAASAIQSLNQLTPPPSPTPTPFSQPSREPPPTWTPTPDPTPRSTLLPRPTFTPRPTRTPTQPPAPWPTFTATATPTPELLPRPPAGQPPYFAPARAPGQTPATLDDFWAGNAVWVIDEYDVGLPMGESDTVYRGGGEYWSYLNASHHSANVVDSCGDAVPFPGCVTLWKSYDGGRHFALENPVCLFPCTTCPCDPNDHVQQQQYPRVVFDADRAYMVYEWEARAYLRTSTDGVHWSGPTQVPDTGMWYSDRNPCDEIEHIGKHPNTLRGLQFDCLAGGPPGLAVAGNLLYVFIGLGQSPGHMGCLVGDKYAGVEGLRPCASNPLFGSEADYGPLDALEATANAYFEFRTISSADVLRFGSHYYMAYEGTRGPSERYTRDDQFGLGFARSVGLAIDGPWEKHPGNPAITDMADNWGIGHADLIVLGSTTYLYTTTSQTTRGRYVLVQR
ncbi:MAG: hypothetical protein JXA14_07420 [Anaerolineae bacterium]|nr:hypothetical protein [Anaerolineae bacterium]